MTPPASPGGLPPRRNRLARTAKRSAVATVGGGLLAGGAVLLVLPGPGLLVIVAGLAVLASEFAWAERRLHQARAKAQQAAGAARRRTRRRPPPTPTDPERKDQQP